MLREDRHAAEENFVAEATRRRRKSSRASFFFKKDVNNGGMTEYGRINLWNRLPNYDMGRVPR